jgi:beta-mannosidase
VSTSATAIRTGLPAGVVSSVRTVSLEAGWSLASTDAGRVARPGEIDGTGLEWRDAVVPGTVAMALGPSDDLDGHQDYDALDWWYRCVFAAPPRQGGERVRLRFDGLATLAQVWLNGRMVLESTNMFTAHSVDVTELVASDNELLIVFRSLGHALAVKRPRPRWKTKLVDHQQLRWFRTTLLGRIPGWTPSIKPVGPWQRVWLESVAGPEVTSLDLRASVEGRVGVVRLNAEVRVEDGPSVIESASLRVAGSAFELTVEQVGNVAHIRGDARVADPELWWPRTHGSPTLHDCELTLTTPRGTTTVDVGRIGFREVVVDTSGGGVRFVVNGVPVFCRGACWTSNDIVSLVGSESDLRRTLQLAADANANMLRVGGTMVYESDAFYRTCDELGLMVWQDLMFANMDYPVADPVFRESIEIETEQQLRRLQRHPSVVAVCGGSEVEQQAAMFGAPREVWTNDFFSETAPTLVSEILGEGTPYWTSTPTGGALPFHVSTGIAHYFGVGAYLRPLEDVRTAGVRFSPECLGFSNVPESHSPQSLDPRHPAWKRGVPRDSGAAWDFEDVRDHYLRLVYGVDPAELRDGDLARYLALSRVVTGRVMAHVFDEWRSAESTCGGGLVWFLKDLRPGAGWGIIGSDNVPKATYYYLKRAWAPVRITLLDRGLDGLRVEVRNETQTTVHGELELSVLSAGSVLTAKASKAVSLAPGSVMADSVDALFGHFTDSTYAYRFGPRAHAAVVARLGVDGSSDGWVEVRWSALAESLPNAEVNASVRPNGDRAVVVLEATRLARDVHVDCPGWAPADNYVDLPPGEARSLWLHPLSAPPSALGGLVEAANLTSPHRVFSSE